MTGRLWRRRTPTCPVCVHVPTRTTNSVRDRSDALPGRPGIVSAGHGRSAEKLLQRADEPTSRIDVELRRKPQNLLAHAKVNGAGAGVLAHEIADLAHERIGQSTEREHHLNGRICTGCGELEAPDLPADQLRLILSKIQPTAY